MDHPRLLLVDDEAGLLDLLKRYLERLGYQVDACTAPEDAIALYAQGAEIPRAGSRTFAHATQFFPFDLARSAHAVYWFSSYTRTLDRADLGHWIALVTGGLRGRLARHPVLDVFLDTVDHRG